MTRRGRDHEERSWPSCIRRAPSGRSSSWSKRRPRRTFVGLGGRSRIVEVGRFVVIRFETPTSIESALGLLQEIAGRLQVFGVEEGQPRADRQNAGRRTLVEIGRAHV